MEKKLKLKLKIRKRPISSEVDNLKCDNRKIKKITKWKAKTSIETGLIKTINWIKRNKKYYIKNFSI